MNISIIGPEKAGKTTLTKTLANKAANGRPINFIGKIKSDFNNITIDKFHLTRNCVNIIDDANAFLENYDLMKIDNKLKEPVIMSRHYNLFNIFVFHSMDDSIKFLLRQSRYIYISNKYLDESFFDSKLIPRTTPVTIGKEPFTFDRYKRY